MAAPAVIAVMDLEWTSWAGARARRWQGPGEEMEIVQIGAVRLADAAALPELAALDVLVRPSLNPTLSDYFTELTGITQARVERDGIGFAGALARLVDFFEGVEAVWAYGRDHEVIERNCRLNGLAFPFPESLFKNARPLFEKTCGIDTNAVFSSGLPAALGFPPPGNAHQGVDDCRCIAEAFRILRRRGEF